MKEKILKTAISLFVMTLILSPFIFFPDNWKYIKKSESIYTEDYQFLASISVYLVGCFAGLGVGRSVDVIFDYFKK